MYVQGPTDEFAMTLEKRAHIWYRNFPLGSIKKFDQLQQTIIHTSWRVRLQRQVWHLSLVFGQKHGESLRHFSKRFYEARIHTKNCP